MIAYYCNLSTWTNFWMILVKQKAVRCIFPHLKYFKCWIWSGFMNFQWVFCLCEFYAKSNLCNLAFSFYLHAELRVIWPKIVRWDEVFGIKWSACVVLTIKVYSHTSQTSHKVLMLLLLCYNVAQTSSKVLMLFWYCYSMRAHVRTYVFQLENPSSQEFIYRVGQNYLTHL